MASLDLDDLTDQQIRDKLVELGQDVGPVTSTTRKVYVKKLRSLLNQSQLPVDLNNSVKNGPDYTAASTSFERDSGPRRVGRSSIASTPPRVSKSPKRKSPTRSALNNSALFDSNVTDFKISPVKQTLNSYVSPPSATTYETKRYTRNYVGLNSSATSSQGIYGDEDSENDVSLSRSTRPSLSYSSKDNFKVTRDSHSEVSPIDQTIGLSDAFKSRLQASTSSSSSYTSPITSRLSTSSQPYASEFVKKLAANKSGFSPNNSSNNLSSKLLDVKESDDEDTGATPVYTMFTQGGRGSPTSHRRGKRANTYQDSWLPFDSPVSAVLLFMFSLFFIILGVTYVNMHSSDTSIALPSALDYILCNEGDGSMQQNGSCLKKADAELASRIVKFIHYELHERLKNSPCDKISYEGFRLSSKELEQAIHERDPSLEKWIIDGQMSNIEILISSNPKLKLLKFSGGFGIENPPMPTYCFILNNLYAIASLSVKVLIALAILAAVYVCFHYWKVKQASHKDNVCKLVTNIIEIIASRAQGPESYVPVDHVRDQLISHNDRQRMEKLWNDAVEVINNDSRVRCEQQVIEGDTCLIWRWIASSYNPNKRKTWQGQAFDTMEGSVNSLPSSPTSCLKIRHMFDAALEEGDDWVGTVVEAILDKTADAKILHIAVERQSREGCVYMKCATPADAGIAYRALHGSWFDSKLVTVKYIREARYLERFPESAKCKISLHSKKLNY